VVCGQPVFLLIFFAFLFLLPGSAFKHALHHQFHALFTRAGVFGGFQVPKDLAAQRQRERVERFLCARFRRQRRRQVFRDERRARRLIEHKRYFHFGPSVDFQFSPDAAVHVEAEAATASRNQRAFERQPFDEAMHRRMLGVLRCRGAQRGGDVTGDINAAHDPDLLDGRDKDVFPVGVSHGARITRGRTAGKDGVRGSSPEVWNSPSRRVPFCEYRAELPLPGNRLHRVAPTTATLRIAIRRRGELAHARKPVSTSARSPVLCVVSGAVEVENTPEAAKGRTPSFVHTIGTENVSSLAAVSITPVLRSDVLPPEALAIDFLAMSDAEDQHDQAVVFDLRDKPVITHAVFPELPKS
jgi:hypothetical protein